MNPRPLATIGSAVLGVLIIGGSFFYVSHSKNEERLGQHTVTPSPTQETGGAQAAQVPTQPIDATVANGLITYTQPDFGVRFSFPEQVESASTTLSRGNYFDGEIEITEDQFLEKLSTTTDQVGWNMGLFGTCNEPHKAYCFGLYMGVWSVNAGKTIGTLVPSLSNSEYQVYYSETDEPRYDLVQGGSGSPSYTGTYMVLDTKRNYYVYFGFLSAKSQGDALSTAEAEDEKVQFDRVKNTVVPNIIKTVTNTKTDVYPIKHDTRDWSAE